MKKVTIKNDRVIAVWKLEEEADYASQYTDFDEQIEVDDDKDVVVGMEKRGTQRISFIRSLTTEQQQEVDALAEVDAKKRAIKEYFEVEKQSGVLEKKIDLIFNVVKYNIELDHMKDDGEFMKVADEIEEILNS